MGELGGQLQVFFDDYEITKIMRILDLDRGIFLRGASRTKSRNNKRGVTYLGTSSNVSTITMSFKFYDDLISKRRELARVFSVDEPKKLIFGDEPDKYYLAYPSSDISISEAFKLGSGTITFEVPDGLAYSTTETTFTNIDQNDYIQNYISINNPGTLPMKLNVEATFHSDSGFLALESDDGESKVMFGNTEEADGEDYQRSEQLITTTDFADWKDGTVNHENAAKICNMKLTVTDDGKGKMLGSLDGEMQTTGSWSGAIKTIQIPADSEGKTGAKNWYVWARHWFETTQMGQTGTCSVSVCAADGTAIASYIIEKSDYSGNTAIVWFKTCGTSKIMQKKITFTPAYWISANPYTSRQQFGGGPWDLKKEGNKITFYWYGGYHSFIAPGTENLEAAYIEYYVGQYNGRSLDTTKIGGQLPGHHLRYLSFTKFNVDKWADNPNVFGEDDVLTYGQTDRNFYATLNGMQALGLRDPASTSIVVPPGESKILVAYSSFGSAPTVKLTGRAVYA